MEKNNRLRKKEEALVHNATLEVSENLLQVGECKCGGSLFMYLKSEPQNYFKIYCSDCSSQSDLRFPKKGDIIYNGPGKVLDYITLNAYGEEEINKHKDDPSCANRSKRVKLLETQLLEDSR